MANFKIVMENNEKSKRLRINLLSLNCHLAISPKGTDNIMLKYNGKRLYPQGGKKFLEFKTGDAHKFEEFAIAVEKADTSEPLLIELWSYNKFFRNKLVGRFFLITDLSQLGFSATQLIRNSEYDQSNYLLHWEKRAEVSGEILEKEQKNKVHTS